jgi:hypothetical protein
MIQLQQNKIRPQTPNKRQLRLIKRQRDASDFIKTVKQNAICADCGKLYPPEVFEFDHKIPRCISGKKPMHRLNSLNRVKRELINVDIVCANCHAIRTKKSGLRSGFGGLGEPRDNYKNKHSGQLDLF